ncbi:MAG: LPS-assembly lipoprotein LptE [Candidatus Eutrophobiaceae bacterium]
MLPTCPKPFAVLLLALIGLSACGFHLRGYPPDDASKTTDRAQAVGNTRIFVVAGGSGIAAIVQGQLAELGAKSAASGADAWQVIISAEQEKERLLSVDPSTGKAREYELIFSLALAVRNPKGELVYGGILERKRDFIYDETAALSTSDEREGLRTELREELAHEILETFIRALPN